MQTIYFVRHGQSEANLAGLVAGSELESPLTPKGIEQAKATGQQLKSKSIDAIISSPMQRALQTAITIGQEVGINADDIIQSTDFVERAYGPYSGLQYEQYMQDMENNAVQPGVESSEDLHARVAKGIDWLRQLPYKNIVVVGHGGVGRMVKVIDQDLHHKHFHTIDRVGNAEIYQFTL